MTENKWFPKVGEEFEDYEILTRAMDNYGASNRQAFVLRSTTIENSRFKEKGIPNQEKLRYVYLQFLCFFGGHVRQNKSQVNQLDTRSGERQTSTYKRGCSFVVKVRLNPKLLDRLEIYEVNLDHENHPHSQAFFGIIPKNRRLTAPVREEVQKMLEMRANSQLIKNDLLVKHNKVLFNKDLANIKAEQKRKTNGNDLPSFVELLKTKHGCCTVDILTDCVNKAFKGLFFCTEQMKQSMSNWPEMLLIDGTYKLFNLNFTLLVFLVQNGIRRGEIAGAAILASEDKSTLRWATQTFYNNNMKACENNKVIMTDKDLTARSVLKEIFPDSALLLCRWHTLKSFGRALTKLKLDKEIKERCAVLLQRLTYSSSEEEYQIWYQMLLNEAPEAVVNYFHDNWHENKAEWTQYNMAEGNFGNFTNNLLESLNHLIKLVVEQNSTLCHFANRFFALTASHNQETDLKSASEVLKIPTKIVRGEYSECMKDYCDLLCKPAFEDVGRELKQSEYIDLQLTNPSTNTYSITFKRTKIEATPTGCYCDFNRAYNLPCKHMFAIRKLLEMPMFDRSICDQRWTKEYTMQTHRVNNLASESISSPYTSKLQTIKRKNKMSSSEKREMVTTIASDIINTVTNMSGLRFENKINVLNELAAAWRNGDEVKIDKIRVEPSLQSTADCNEESDKENCPENSSSSNLRHVMMPTPRRVLGRPSGFNSTISAFSPRKQSIKVFLKKKLDEQQFLFLTWIIPQGQITNVMNGEYIIRYETISHLTDKNLKNSVASTQINLLDFRHFFDSDAFNHLKELVILKRINQSWFCSICNNSKEDEFLECQGCLDRWHSTCVSPKRKSSKQWQCDGCRKKKP